MLILHPKSGILAIFLGRYGTIYTIIDWKMPSKAPTLWYIHPSKVWNTSEAMDASPCLPITTLSRLRVRFTSGILVIFSNKVSRLYPSMTHQGLIDTFIDLSLLTYALKSDFETLQKQWVAPLAANHPICQAESRPPTWYSVDFYVMKPGGIDLVQPIRDCMLSLAASLFFSFSSSLS